MQYRGLSEETKRYLREDVAPTCEAAKLRENVDKFFSIGATTSGRIRVDLEGVGGKYVTIREAETMREILDDAIRHASENTEIAHSEQTD